MCRRFTAGTLNACVVLLMFGTSSLADEEVFIDLSAAFENAPPTLVRAEIAAVTDNPAVPVESDLSGDVAPFVEENPAMPLEAAPASPIRGQGLSLWNRPAPSYPLPSRSFSLFQSPASYGWAYFERCCPRPWKPRGNGIPRRTSSYRMDYRPYTLQHTESVHGPAFYQRFELYPCEECHHHRKHLQRHYDHP